MQGAPLCLPLESAAGADSDLSAALAQLHVAGAEVRWQAAFENRYTQPLVLPQDRQFVRNPILKQLIPTPAKAVEAAAARRSTAQVAAADTAATPAVTIGQPAWGATKEPAQPAWAVANEPAKPDWGVATPDLSSADGSVTGALSDFAAFPTQLSSGDPSFEVAYHPGSVEVAAAQELQVPSKDAMQPEPSLCIGFAWSVRIHISSTFAD